MSVTINSCPICDNTSFEPYLSCKDYTVSHETFQLKTCTTCGLIMTSPRPNNLDEYYKSQDYISHSKSSTGLFQEIYFAVRRYALKQKLKLANRYVNASDKNVLDYGCGTGEFLRTLALNNWNITGIEPSPDARAAVSHEIAANIYPSLDHLSSQNFQLITMWHVLEHTDNPRQVLNQLYQNLEKGSTIFIAVPNPESYDAKHYGTDWAGYDVPRHLWHFTPPTMKLLLQKTAFHLMEIRPMKFDSFYVSLLSEKYKRQNHFTLSGIFRAVYNGMISNHKARQTGAYSSLIYIAKK